MKRRFILFTIFLLVIMNINTFSTYAETNNENDEENELAKLYEDVNLKTLLLEIKEDAEVTLVEIIDHEELGEILFVKYHSTNDELSEEKLEDNENVEPIIEGYILREDVDPNQDFEIDALLNIYPSNKDQSEDETENTDNSKGSKDEEVGDEGEKPQKVIKQSLTNFSITTESIEEIPANYVTLYGVALKKTNIYSSQSKNSKVLKSYSTGSILKYEGNDTTKWYEATVKVNGKWEKGFIYYTDVENGTNNPNTFRGIGLKNKTHVYSSASTSSKKQKSYAQGTLLKYQTFTKDWYKATVMLSGKWVDGYIHRTHVEEPTKNPKTLYGIALKSKTHVYAKASTSSKKLKSYTVGKTLKYKSFTKNWYEATVLVNGKYKTGYIHKSHVEKPVDKQKTLRGIGLKNKTHVYTEGSTSSPKLKSYAQGTLLKYKSFTQNWYEAKVKVNGKYKTGYIHKSHVEEPVDKPITVQGIAQKNSTHIYQRASTSSKKLKSYKQGAVLKYKSFTKDWHEARVMINGKYVTGFIHRTHVDSKLLQYTDYKITLEKAIDIQRGRTTKFSRNQYREYMDPSRNDSFQHLRLDTSIGVSATQLNKTLSGKGTLDRQGQSFINGAKKYGVNEAYLIAHSILETGHGTSKLAQGIEVGLNKDGKAKMVTSTNRKNLTNIKTTYNMFGIGAVDKCPNECGSERAYKEGWFSPKQAIEGGAGWIAEQYIQNEHKQNTLYKMKWNPNMYNGYAWKQYATDAGWAVKQTTFIKNIYNQVNNPLYHYDIAKYK